MFALNISGLPYCAEIAINLLPPCVSIPFNAKADVGCFTAATLEAQACKFQKDNCVPLYKLRRTDLPQDVCELTQAHIWSITKSKLKNE